KLNGVNMGLGYGDLFLASSWNPEGSDAHNSLDDHATGTLWEYGIAIDNRWWDGTSAGGGSAILYKLTGGSNNANALLSEDFLSGGTYRNGQEIAVDTSVDHDIVDANASWSIDAANKKISFMFDIGGTGLLDNGELALHWAMTCGNDTIEGSYDVPEPGSLSLMGLSLLMAGLVSRRKRKT
ncbi:MAG: PEP-CTERM sorting domain-containing protein, partial [Gammaproteobacteria bacterium]|nr:PEP-CTERM sorting domain-containing protein [Gammaproteobacteria bacterium]